MLVVHERAAHKRNVEYPRQRVAHELLARLDHRKSCIPRTRVVKCTSDSFGNQSTVGRTSKCNACCIRLHARRLEASRTVQVGMEKVSNISVGSCAFLRSLWSVYRSGRSQWRLATLEIGQVHAVTWPLSPLSERANATSRGPSNGIAIHFNYLCTYGTRLVERRVIDQR